MAISFSCECGKVLKAKDELAGRKTRCPQCQSPLTIPRPAPVEPEEDEFYSLDEPEPSTDFKTAAQAPSPASDSTYRPSVQSAWPTSPTPRKSSASKPSRPTKSRPVTRAGGSSILEFTYLLLLFALVPLVFSLMGEKNSTDFDERLARTIEKAPPEEQRRIEGVLNGGEITLDEAIAAMPGHQLDGAHLPRDTSLHWVYAGVATAGFLLMLGLCFSVERANPLHLLGIGAFTGTIGIILLLLVQFCTQFRLTRFRGGGIVVIIFMILMFIGWSYDSANDPDSNFLLSALGYTFGVGLCEEFTKAIPLFFYFKRHSDMGWRGACLWGLASGIGFGVSEGVMYSSRYYNGISGGEIYLVRFISCVALHAMWAASVGIAIARNVDSYEQIEDAAGFGLFMLRVMAVPMLLHGFYDTLLKMDMNGWALVTALLSFGWLAWHVELARSTQPDAGRARVARHSAAY